MVAFVSLVGKLILAITAGFVAISKGELHNNKPPYITLYRKKQ